MNFRKIEKNGLVIISFAAALLYWYFDSLHPGELISRVFTSFLFISYGFFTQYLINSYVEQRNIEAKDHDLLDHINDGIYRLNKDGYFTFANKVIMDSAGIPLEKLYDYHYLDIVAPEDHETARKNFEKVMKGEEAATHELKYKTADGNLRVMEINTTPIHGQGGIVGLQSISRDITERKRGEVALQQEHAELEQRVVERTEELKRINEELQKDITERKQAEDALRAAETRYRMLFEHSPDGIVIIDPAAVQFLEFNETAHQQLGYSREEFAPLSISDLEVSETSDETRTHIQKVIHEGRGDFDTLHRTKQGEIRNIHVIAQYTEIMGHPVYHCIWRDITKHKRAEEELKYAHDRLRDLAIRLQEVREETRTAISQDLHDDVGGKLAGLKMDLLRLEGIVSKVNDVEQRNVLMEVSHQAKELINNTILSARRIMMELRPSILDDFGLVAALEWQVEEFKTHTGISCQFVVEQQKVDMEKHTATSIFRIFQELLTNTARHSGATEVITRLSSDKEMLVLEVTDNGRGITEQQLSGRESLGLMGMKERALAIGGTIHVRGESGKGTSVALRVPMGREG